MINYNKYQYIINNLPITILFIGLIWGKPIEIDKKVAKYSSEDDYFIYDDSPKSIIGVSDLISIVKDSSALPRVDFNKGVHLIIDKYSKQKKEFLITKKRYEQGAEIEDGSGRMVIEQNHLINNSETWYIWSTIFMILPAVPWLKEKQKYENPDRKMGDEYPTGVEERLKELGQMATIGIKPGILIGLIGFIGSKIKLSEKKYIIMHSSIQEPKLSDFPSTDEIASIILAYNSLQDDG